MTTMKLAAAAALAALAAASAFPSLMVQGEPRQVATPASAAAAAADNGAGGCAACKLATAEAERLLAKNGTEAKVEAFVKDQVCPLAGDKEAAQCVALAPLVVPKAIAAAEAYLPTACAAVGACASAADGAGECKICTLIATEAESLLAKNTTEAEIEAELEKLCSLLPGDYPGTCDAYVQGYLPTVISLLEQEESPEKVCEALHLCTPAAPAAPLPLGDSSCSTCEFLLTEAKQVLGDNATVAKIVSEAEGECAKLGGAAASECSALVQTYGPAACALAAQYIEPTADCTKLGLCGAPPQPLVPARPAGAAADQ